MNLFTVPLVLVFLMKGDFSIAEYEFCQHANAISIFSSAKRSAVTVILCCCVHGPILFSLVYHLYNET